jgi:hypothetical protein
MAVTHFWYAKAFLSFFNKEADFDTDTIKIGLTTNTYTPNQDTHQYYDVSITNELTTANGYTAGGYTLANKTISNTNNVITLDNTVDPAWTTGAGETLTARRSFIYDSSPASNKPLMTWIDFGQDESASNGGSFTIVLNASGIATITPSDATGFP